MLENSKTVQPKCLVQSMLSTKESYIMRGSMTLFVIRSNRGLEILHGKKKKTLLEGHFYYHWLAL